MKTSYTVYRADGTSEELSCELPRAPIYEEIAGIVCPQLDGATLEHVAVLHEGERRDMFVDDHGSIKGLPRNEAATEIYRANSMARDPKLDPETLPAIYGPAVLFGRRIWF